MNHEQAITEATEAFKARMKQDFYSVGLIGEALIANFKYALEHYRVARGEDDAGLVGFAETVTRLTPKDGLSPDALWHLVDLAKARLADAGDPTP